MGQPWGSPLTDYGGGGGDQGVVSRGRTVSSPSARRGVLPRLPANPLDAINSDTIGVNPFSLVSTGAYRAYAGILGINNNKSTVGDIAPVSGSLVMYDSASCSYAGALELKGASGAGAAAAAPAGVTAAGVKQENWPYRGLTCGSTFQRLKESVDKAKQALADRSGYLAGAFSPPPRANPSTISPTASITGKHNFFYKNLKFFSAPFV
ncbi:hypothetical protein EAG_10151 [Camponotus floridanus]|uniref:Uncharacterized protein n=1 Tax=Camponotus floridanus TaxID=104421 RepID=E2AJZ8_CAMFO|nr:hypothetical protein EAG_10151 [Camponotus floridanus]